jgi:transcriptional regulator with XRE-family HTH domain
MNKLKQLRGDLSLRQLSAEIEKLTGTKISYNSIDNYEKGVNFPNSIQLLAIAKYFNVSTDYLLDYNLDSSKEVPNIALSKEELKDLVDSLDYLSSKIKSLLDE